MTPAGVTDEFMALIERAGPYGQGNPEPRFAFPAHRVKFAKVVGTAHVRCTLEAGDGSRLDAVAFRAADQPVGAALLASAGMPLHVVGPPAPRHLERPRPPRTGHRGRGRPAPARLSELQRRSGSTARQINPIARRCHPVVEAVRLPLRPKEGSFTRRRGTALPTTPRVTSRAPAILGRRPLLRHSRHVIASSLPPPGNLTISGRRRACRVSAACSLRLSVRTSDFQSEKRGSTPLGSAICEQNCELPAPGRHSPALPAPARPFGPQCGSLGRRPRYGQRSSRGRTCGRAPRPLSVSRA